MDRPGRASPLHRRLRPVERSLVVRAPHRPHRHRRATGGGALPLARRRSVDPIRGERVMTLESRHRSDVPQYEFNVNTVLPIGEHWAMVDEMQDRHPYFWTTYAAGHWVLTDPNAIREAYGDYAT